MSGVYICQLCEFAGAPADERFTAPDDEAGLALMVEHVHKPHPAQRLRSAVPGGESVDIALTDGDAS